MEYILRDKIKIIRPIVFLCGPYYRKKDKRDRRAILRKFFYEHFQRSILPLIIDDFLTEDNMEGQTINLQLMEEIIAAISYKSYIFLDTMSAASELGLFMNHAFVNQTVAYVPKLSDILNKKNIGYFVRDVILNMNADQAQCLEYRPSIRRSVISTDYAVEHYGFIGDTVPENIAEDIKKDPVYQDKKEYTIELAENGEYPNHVSHIYYQTYNGKYAIHLSVRLLFYVVTSLMYEKYPKQLVANKKASITDFDVESIERETISVFSRYLIKHGIPVESNLEISTTLKYSFHDIVYHMVTFCYVYHCFSTYRGLRLVEKHMDTILDFSDEITNNSPTRMFSLTDAEYRMLVDCKKDPSCFYTEFFLTKGGKIRELVKYCDTDEGTALREIHEKMAAALRENYVPSEYSFAYKKGDSIKKCVEKHINSNAFLKYDISKFFNSIELESLIEILSDVLGLDAAYGEITRNIVSSLYYKDKLPLGLVISPVLSDIYMLGFDQKLAQYCQEKEYTYTRYADDILISSKQVLSEWECEETDRVIEEALADRKLKLNAKKKKRIFLSKEGHYIKYIGVNITFSTKGNRLSVGRQYINCVAKEYLHYRKDANHPDNNISEKEKEHLFYEERRIAGKVAFVKQIEGDTGMNKIRNRLKNVPECFDGDRLIFLM